MSERSLWIYVRRGMAGKWDATRHEDRINLGIPDVSYGITEPSLLLESNSVNGWIELKKVRAWSKGIKRPFIRLPKFTIEQRDWLIQRGLHGGRCWLLLQVRREYFLFSWKNDFVRLFDLINVYSRDYLKRNACGYWEKSINWEDFRTLLYHDIII